MKRRESKKPVKATKPVKVTKSVKVTKPTRSKLTSIYVVRCAKCSKDFKSTNADAVNCPKCSAAVAAKTKPTAVDADAPRIECRLIIGDLSLPIDAASLEHTLGAGEYGHGRGLVDQWPEGAWTALLVHLGLPAEPLDTQVAEQPVKRLVQQLWYEAVKGGVPDTLAFSRRDAARAKEYEENFEHVKETAETRSKTARATLAKVRADRGDAPRTAMAGKLIRVVNKNHGARQGTKRQIGLDIILSTKSVDDAVPLLVKAGCNATFITFAIKEGFIKLV